MRTLLIFLFVMIITSIHGQNSPREVVEKVFSKEKVININDYCTGQYQQNGCVPNGSNGYGKFNLKIEEVIKTDTSALVDMTLLDSLKEERFDIYLYLKKLDIWKIYNIIEPDPVDDKILTWGKYSENQLDSIYIVENISSSLEQFKNIIRRLKLFYSVDKQIIAFYKSNNLKFGSLLDLIKTTNTTGNNNENAKKLSQDLCIEDIDIEENLFHFRIGANPYNGRLVGFLYVESNKDLPKVSPDNYIIIKKITDNWYFYRKQRNKH